MAQTTAMDFNRQDCDGTPHHLFADLDSGKAVILYYYMVTCHACLPGAGEIQTMANNINAIYPGTVKGYSFPFNDEPECYYCHNWVYDNSYTFYAPMDSGATGVAYYGGFGMPTVVLLGGSDHRVLFSTLSYRVTDTLTIKDSILSLIGVLPNGINQSVANTQNISIYPNPVCGEATISAGMQETGDLDIALFDLVGNKVTIIAGKKNVSGIFTTKLNTSILPNGVYTVRINRNGSVVNKQITVLH